MATISIKERMKEWLDYVDYSEKDYRVFLPNEMFDDLNMFPMTEFNFRHKACAYSFYYLTNYLYRNCKFSTIEPLRLLNSLTLLEKLYCLRKNYNFIIKKNDGVLDLLGYTQSENDYPIEFIISEGELESFRMFSDVEAHVKRSMSVPPHFVVKKPLKAFKRSESSTSLDGTFFEYANTHPIDFPIFARCMALGRYGIEAFYLYGFLLAFEGLINKKDKMFRSYLIIVLESNHKKINQLLSLLERLSLIKIVDDVGFKYKIRRSMKLSELE